MRKWQPPAVFRVRSRVWGAERTRPFQVGSGIHCCCVTGMFSAAVTILILNRSSAACYRHREKNKQATRLGDVWRGLMGMPEVAGDLKGFGMSRRGGSILKLIVGAILKVLDLLLIEKTALPKIYSKSPKAS